MDVDLSYSRSAEVVWQGSVEDGQGEITVENGAIGCQSVSLYARLNHPKRKQQTTPEELIAAACATDFAMACSVALTEAGHPPERLTVSAACAWERLVEGGFKLSSLKIEAKGVVPGLDEAEFQRLTAEGDKICPSLNALRQGLGITVYASLEHE